MECSPTHLIVVCRLGFNWETQHRYRRQGHLKIRGEYQDVLTMDRSQDVPDFNLWICAGRFRNTSKWITTCNQPQGSWLVGGIEAWCQGLDATTSVKQSDSDSSISLTKSDSVEQPDTELE